ncbi:unnamed protein product [Closterium sp. NIES-65]|nr:unnamed protein product [Closterium sp. NIES-65]
MSLYLFLPLLSSLNQPLLPSFPSLPSPSSPLLLSLRPLSPPPFPSPPVPPPHFPADGAIRPPTRGPCSTAFQTLTISTQADFNLRTTYSNTTTVVLYLAGNVTLNSSLFFTSNFSCSIIRALPSLSYMPWLWYTRIDAPAVRVLGATNVQFIGIGIGFPFQYTSAGMVACGGLPEFPSRWTCPVLHLYRAWAVTFANGRIHGRTDVYRSGATEFSYMKLWHDYYDRDLVFHSWSVIRFAMCGDPVNLIRSLNRVTNCEIRGSWTPVLMYAGTVGTIIANNFITDFQFGGVQCGQGDGNVADCMLNTIQDNIITAESAIYPVPNGDGSGIYYDLHWYNPGNLDTCNYVIAGTHCYYLDFATSGLTIDGAVCIRNHDGVKINTGHGNKIQSVIVVKPTWQSGIMSCQNWCDNNCHSWAGRGLGYKWYTTFISRFETPGWRKNWPFLSNLCNRTEWAPGIPCNPSPPVEAAKNWTGYCSQHLGYNNGKQLSASANVTANCSGVPGLNHVEMIVINGTGGRWNPYYINCDALPSVRPTNNITTTTTNYPWGFFDFDNVTGEDFGVSNLSSRMYQLYPHFMTCSRRRAGIQRQMRALSAAASTIQSSFGVNPASWWHDVYASIPYNKEISSRIVSEKLLKRISTNRPRQNPGQKEKKTGNGGMGFQMPTIPVGGGGGGGKGGGWSVSNWWKRRKTLERGAGYADADDVEGEEESIEQEELYEEFDSPNKDETRHEHFNVLEYDPYAGGDDRLGGDAFDHLWI